MAIASIQMRDQILVRMASLKGTAIIIAMLVVFGTWVYYPLVQLILLSFNTAQIGQPTVWSLENWRARLLRSPYLRFPLEYVPGIWALHVHRVSGLGPHRVGLGPDEHPVQQEPGACLLDRVHDAHDRHHRGLDVPLGRIQGLAERRAGQVGTLYRRAHLQHL